MSTEAPLQSHFINCLTRLGLSFLKLACGDKQAAEVTDEASPTATGCE